MALTPNFEAALQNNQFSGNLVAEIDGVYFSQYQVDTGLVVDDNKLGVLDGATVNGVAIDIRRANTPIATIGLKIVDKDEVFSTFMGASANTLQGSQVKLYFGFRTGDFDFSDYALLGTSTINMISRLPNGYTVKCKAVTDLMQRPLLNVNSTIDGAVSTIDIALDIDDTTDFPTSGMIKLNEEFITYNNIVGNTLTGLARGELSSEIKNHDDGDVAYLVTKKEDIAINILTDILLNDLAIDPSKINLDSFNEIFNNYFDTDPADTLYIYNVDNALTWIESRILSATNTRLFSVNGQITLGILDQLPVFGDVPEINEDHIQSPPSWSVNSDKIVNKIIVKWAYNEGKKKFEQTTTFRDEESINIFGLRSPLTIQLYGVFNPVIVANRATRLLGRFSTPKASVKVKTHFNRFGINIADAVRVVHRYLPQSGGSLGFNGIMEVMTKSTTGFDKSAKVNFNLEFSSYTGIRLGLISPSPKLDLSIIDQKTIEVPDGSCYEVGYRVRLFNNVTNVYHSDPINEIVAIDGNILTMANEFTTVLNQNSSLYFADYDNSSGNQRARYSYVAPDTGFFVDDSKAYQIIF